MSDNVSEFDTQSATSIEGLAQYLTFKAAGQHYGILTSAVIEIAKISPITDMPELPSYIKGIINMRGRVIPLIDINLRFGKSEKEYTDRTCVIIVNINETHMGMVVDGVDEVLDIETSRISPPPPLVSDASGRYITGIAKLDKHMVLLVDCHLLFSDSDTLLLNQSLNQ